MIRILVLLTVLTASVSAAIAQSGTPAEAGRVPPGCPPVLPCRQAGGGRRELFLLASRSTARNFAAPAARCWKATGSDGSLTRLRSPIQKRRDDDARAGR